MRDINNIELVRLNLLLNIDRGCSSEVKLRIRPRFEGEI
jgi:hypothetical protein